MVGNGLLHRDLSDFGVCFGLRMDVVKTCPTDHVYLYEVSNWHRLGCLQGRRCSR